MTAQTATEKQPVLKQKRVSKSRVGLQAMYHGMMLPGMAFLIIFCYIPMFGIIMAFQDYVPGKGISGSPFVGLKHFIYMFTLPDIGQIVLNTLIIALGKIILSTLAGILFAVLLSEIRIQGLKKTVQTIVYLPHFLSWVVLASVVVNLFSLDGSVNHLIEAFGADKVNFLGSNAWFRPLLIFTDVWKEFGYGSIIYLAAITGIDPGLHEAAQIDGAGWWRRVWHITLPGMMPIIMLQAAMSLSGILSAGFDQVYNLYTPMVYQTGDILDTYVYRIGLVGRQYSFSTAVGLIKSAIGMALMLSMNEAAKKTTGRKIF